MGERILPSGEVGNPMNVLTYFIQQGESGPIKIGTTFDLKKRLTTLQTGSPYKLHVLGTMSGDHERRLHDVFSEFRLEGEWFENNSKLRLFINGNAKLPDASVQVLKVARELVAVYERVEMEIYGKAACMDNPPEQLKLLSDLMTRMKSFVLDKDFVLSQDHRLSDSSDVGKDISVPSVA